MKEPSNKDDLLQAMRTARAEWDSLIAQVPPDRWEEPGASGDWTLRDVVAHVTAYDRWLALGLALRLQKPSQVWLDDISLDEFNARLHQELRDGSAAQVSENSAAVFRAILQELEARPEAYLFGTHKVDGVPYDVVPSQLLKSESYGHYRDHMPAIRAWLSSAPSEGTDPSLGSLQKGEVS